MALTDFQKRCEALLTDALSKVGVSPQHREIITDTNPDNDQECIIKIHIKNLNICIYSDEAQVKVNSDEVHVEDVFVERSGHLIAKSGYSFKMPGHIVEDRQIQALIEMVVELINRKSAATNEPNSNGGSKGCLKKVIFIIVIITIAVLIFFAWAESLILEGTTFGT